MKQLACEMCGSTDIIKQEGVFVCQTCGCKYSVEDAKKMMIEGTVDVSGSTIKIDTSDELKNLYQLARRSLDNKATAAKYYDMILMKDPTSWEATFYSLYFAAWQNVNLEFFPEATFGDGLDLVIQLISDSAISTDEKMNAVQEVNIKTKEIGEYFWNNALSQTPITPIDEANQSVKKFRSAIIFLNLGNALYKYFPMQSVPIYLAINAWNKYIDLNDKCFGLYGAPPEDKLPIQKKISEAKKRLNDIDIEQQQKKQEAAQKYWLEHPEEKAQIDNELVQINNQIEILNKEIAPLNEQKQQFKSELDKRKDELQKEQTKSLPIDAEINQLKSHLSTLYSNLNDLGIFKGKQKKEMQKEIDATQAQLSKSYQTAKQEHEQQRSEINKQIAQVTDEFHAKIESMTPQLVQIQDQLDNLDKRKKELQQKLENIGDEEEN